MSNQFPKTRRADRRKQRARECTEWRVFWAVVGIGVYMLLIGIADLSVNGWNELFLT